MTAADQVGFIAPGATLGVMGGGQLARMFVHAAQRMGYATAVLDPDPLSPAGLVAHHHVQAEFTDVTGLAALSHLSAAITTEFENVPADSLARLAQTSRVAPAAAPVEVCQDRAAEKACFARGGVPCAPHCRVATLSDLQTISHDLLPGVLKTQRLGYDGKGQVRVANLEQLKAGWQALGEVPCVLEKLLPLHSEISVIVARGAQGDVVSLPVQQNLHREGVLVLTRVPALEVSPALHDQARRWAHQAVNTLGYVGVLCVEFFVLSDGSLVANEMAPRPHNSGHYSMDACDVSQFELQVRALTGAPLPTPRQHSAALMLNLLGDLWLGKSGVTTEPAWAQVLALPGAHLHLYGKAKARAGRKMGHLTFTAARCEDAERSAERAAAILGIEPWSPCAP